MSAAVDRQAIANTVYLGNAVPILGPVSPGNVKWYAADSSEPRPDLARARSLLSGLGLADRNNDGMLETAAGEPVRFSVLVQAGHIRAQVASALQAQLKTIGIQLDVVAMDGKSMFGRMQAGDYEAIYHGLQASSTDPALNAEFWLSSGESHFWNPAQKSPDGWERRIDDLMREQAQALEIGQRQRAFAEVQRIMRDELPAIYFVAPRVSIATTMRVVNATPACSCRSCCGAPTRWRCRGRQPPGDSGSGSSRNTGRAARHRPVHRRSRRSRRPLRAGRVVGRVHAGTPRARRSVRRLRWEPGRCGRGAPPVRARSALGRAGRRLAVARRAARLRDVALLSPAGPRARDGARAQHDPARHLRALLATGFGLAAGTIGRRARRAAPPSRSVGCPQSSCRCRRS